MPDTWQRTPEEGEEEHFICCVPDTWQALRNHVLELFVPLACLEHLGGREGGREGEREGPTSAMKSHINP